MKRTIDPVILGPVRIYAGRKVVSRGRLIQTGTTDEGAQMAIEPLTLPAFRKYLKEWRKTQVKP